MTQTPNKPDKDFCLITQMITEHWKRNDNAEGGRRESPRSHSEN